MATVAAVGAQPADQLLAGQDAPLSVALSEGAGIGWGADIVTFGALVAITSVVLTMLFGETRVAFSMCRDGLLPERLAAVWEKTRTPVILTVLFAVPIALVAAFVPLTEIAELVNIGTLFAFFLVNVAVICGAASPTWTAASGCRSCRSYRRSARGSTWRTATATRGCGATWPEPSGWRSPPARARSA